MAAVVAVAIRLLLPLSPAQLPTLTVVVFTAIATTLVGVVAGITTAVIGGFLSWYAFFTPYSWELSRDGVIPLIGFAIIATVIVTTSHLYRRSERRNHDAELRAVMERAEAADLFAREQAHRLKNALAIIQSIAFQTLDPDNHETAVFAARLKALADAHDVLQAHEQNPSAPLAQVVEVALRPFSGSSGQFQLVLPDTQVGAQQALTLSLALHELGTNATKYGALSVRGGRVSMDAEEESDRLRLVWKEQGGPPVSTPDELGFGTRFLQRLGMGTALLFEPDGIRAELVLRRK